MPERYWDKIYSRIKFDQWLKRYGHPSTVMMVSYLLFIYSFAISLHRVLKLWNMSFYIEISMVCMDTFAATLDTLTWSLRYWSNIYQQWYLIVRLVLHLTKSIYPWLSFSNVSSNESRAQNKYTSIVYINSGSVSSTLTKLSTYDTCA